MTLARGTRLGPYEVTGTLGAGGMGEVYRAHDTKLNRAVALKVLPDAFAADPDRLARFQREAQVLASLNHPHIGAIYGFEESPSTKPVLSDVRPSTGSGRTESKGSGQAVRALVLELVEGETLAERLSRVGRVLSDPPRDAGATGSGLQVEEALAIARQIADALQAAHEKGIIHRDLKPSNIAFTAEDHVKVLDFGLAKMLEPYGVAGSTDPAQIATHSPTLSLAATQAGTILGTAAYMAPEQAKGRVADKRSDVWAFGCVLYEMLTGKRAFDGEDVTDIIGAVVRLEPDWAALPSECPAAICALLKRCLEKDRQKRIADISTALFVLDESAHLAAASEGPAKAEHYVRGGGATEIVEAVTVVGAGFRLPGLRDERCHASASQGLRRGAPLTPNESRSTKSPRCSKRRASPSATVSSLPMVAGWRTNRTPQGGVRFTCGRFPTWATVSGRCRREAAGSRSGRAMAENSSTLRPMAPCWPCRSRRGGASWNAGSPTKLLEGRYADSRNFGTRMYDVSSDGQRFLMLKRGSDQTNAPPQIIVVQNWFEELKRLVPVD